MNSLHREACRHVLPWMNECYLIYCNPPGLHDVDLSASFLKGLFCDFFPFCRRINEKSHLLFLKERKLTLLKISNC